MIIIYFLPAFNKGFTGKDCDKAIVPCDENPCQNGAVCLLEDERSVCYCVPDYHGALCELKYDDCESKFARCDNGGTCIDGINSFTCSCPPNYGGPMCEYSFASTTVVEVEERSERETSPVKVTTVASPRESTLLADTSVSLSSTSTTSFPAYSTSPRTSSSPYTRKYTLMEKTTTTSGYESSPSVSSDVSVFLTQVLSTSSTTSKDVIRDDLVTSEPVTMSSATTTEGYVTETASAEVYFPTGRSVHDGEVTEEPDDRITKTVISEAADEDMTRVTQYATSR